MLWEYTDVAVGLITQFLLRKKLNREAGQHSHYQASSSNDHGERAEPGVDSLE